MEMQTHSKFQTIKKIYIWYVKKDKDTERIDIGVKTQSNMGRILSKIKFLIKIFKCKKV